jgi:hypothetical protein
MENHYQTALLRDDLCASIQHHSDQVENSLQLNWVYQVPLSKANKLYQLLKIPPNNLDINPGGYAEWRYVDPLLANVENYHYPLPPGSIAPNVYSRLIIKDEEIPHLVPNPHKDFFYTYLKINIPTEKIPDVLAISESISYDSLKQELSARCHLMLPNLVSLYISKLVATGNKSLPHAREEYSILIKTMEKLMKKKGLGIDLGNPSRWDVTLTNYIFETELDVEQFPI